MNDDILSGNWKQLVGEVKKQWGKLTDQDLAQVKGETDKLRGLLQEKYGYAKHKAEEELHKFLDEHADIKSLKDKAAQAFNDFSEEVSEKAKQVKVYTDQTKEYIQASPLTSIAIAAGIGFLVGFLCGKSRDNK